MRGLGCRWSDNDICRLGRRSRGGDSRAGSRRRAVSLNRFVDHLRGSIDGFNGETRYVRRIAENVCPSALCRMTNTDHGTEVNRGTLVNELRSNLGGRVFQCNGDFLDFVSVDPETFAIFGNGNGIKITVPRGVENKAANWQSDLRPFCDETISTSLEFGKSYCGISRINEQCPIDLLFIRIVSRRFPS